MMFRFWLRAAVGVAALAPLHPLSAQSGQLPRSLPPRPTSEAITPADLMTRLYIIADDSMGGRATGTEGHLKATAYIAAEADRLGLRPAGTNGYFQDLPMVRRGFVATSAISLDATRFQLGEDFGVLVGRGASPRVVTEAPIVVGGVFGDSSTWISAEAAKGKVVVLRGGGRTVPMGTRGLTLSASSRFAGAAAYVVPMWDVIPANFRRGLAQPGLAMKSGDSDVELPVTILASNGMVDALVARDGAMLTMNLEYSETPAAARNVVAVLPGSDARLAGQYVALGAHSDHDPLLSSAVEHDSLRAFNGMRRDLIASMPAGQRPTPAQFAELKVNVDSLRAVRPPRRDSVKNGADDDGSGTVALLEIAEALSNGPAPKRSVLFVWHAAEELGLLGADHYTEHPTVPLDSIVAQLNMDMVGRGGVDDIAGGGPRYVQLVGSRRLSKELGDLVETVNARRASPFQFDYALDADGHPERIYCRSDHAMYARYGIPVTFFTTGLHKDYHQVTDEPQYIHYAKFAELTVLVRDVAWELAERPRRVKLDGAKPDPNAPCRQ